MRVLVTNDDGVQSDGLWSLASALTELGDVTVVAPDRDRSGVGTAMTLLEVVRANEIDPPVSGVKALAVQGTPADCVILAVNELSDSPFDVVVSGINAGSNMGMDVLSSGTVGAALRAYLYGIPSIAISVASLANVQFDAAASAAVALARGMGSTRGTPPALLNVNLPNVYPAEIEQVEVTRLGPRAYLETVERGHDGRRTHYWIKHNVYAVYEPEVGTDIWAIRNRRVSITPLAPGLMGAPTSPELQRLAGEVGSALGLG